MSNFGYFKNPVRYYKQLPKALRHQIDKISEKLNSNVDVQVYKTQILNSLSRDKYNKFSLNMKSSIALRLAILLKFNYSLFLTPEWWDIGLYCYDDSGNRVFIKEKIAQTARVFVASGLRNNKKPVVVKMYKSTKLDTSYEIDNYVKLKATGCKMPWFSSTYKFWNHPVLVMEKLEPITKEDDEYLIATHVLEQLEYLHTFAIHNGLKPNNIMKKIKNNKIQYFTIDYGGSATKKLKYGYLRFKRSPPTTSQPKAKKQITTAVNDFIELGYTMKMLQLRRRKLSCKIRKNKKTGKIVDPVRSNFKGRLFAYMKRINKIDPRNVTHKDYQDLILKLKN